MRHHEIFPSSLWHIEGAPQPLVENLYQAAYKIKENHESNTLSNRGGYQSPMFEWKDFHPEGIKYIESIIKKISKSRKQIAFKRDMEWWYNINGKGHWNAPHTHPKCDYALVWYLTDVGDRSQISLRDESLLTLMNPFPQRYGDDNQNISIVALKGDIVIFPADIYHYVMPNPKDEDRISISMNLRLC